jgi:hypothetical protein
MDAAGDFFFGERLHAGTTSTITAISMMNAGKLLRIDVNRPELLTVLLRENRLKAADGRKVLSFVWATGCYRVTPSRHHLPSENCNKRADLTTIVLVHSFAPADR